MSISAGRKDPNRPTTPDPTANSAFAVFTTTTAPAAASANASPHNTARIDHPPPDAANAGPNGNLSRRPTMPKSSLARDRSASSSSRRASSSASPACSRTELHLPCQVTGAPAGLVHRDDRRGVNRILLPAASPPEALEIDDGHLVGR